MSNNNTSNDNKDVDLKKVLECFKQRGVDNQNKIDETKGVDLNEVIKCLQVPMNKPYKIKDTKVDGLKSSRLQVSKSIFEYAQGGVDNEKTYGFIKWYEQAKNNKTIKNVINYIRYKLKKFILNYEYLIKNRENLLKTGIKLSNDNQKVDNNINTSDLKSYFYNHRNVANLLNKNVTTIKKDDKNTKEYNFFDYLKKIYGVFGKFYEEDYGDFIQDDEMMNDKFFDHKFFMIYNVWIFINYYTTQNASLLNEVQDKITRAFRDYFLNINESFNEEDHEFGQLMKHIFLVTNAQKEYLKKKINNEEDKTDMDQENKDNDKKILTRENFDKAFFEVINKNKSLNCYIFPPELFLKLWNEEELYIYFKRDTGSIQGSNDIYEYNSVPEEGTGIDQIDDKLVYLILKDEDDLLIKDKDYLNVQEKDNFSVISRLFNENVFHKQSGTEPINVSDLLRVLAMKDQNTKIIETYLKDGIKNAKKMIDDIKNSATEAFKNVALNRNKVGIAPPRSPPPRSPPAVGGLGISIESMNFDFEFDKYTFKQLLKDKDETSQINQIRNALSSRGEESIKKSIKKLIDNYKRRRFVISYNYTQEGEKNNKKYKCNKTEKKAKQNKYDSCYPIDGKEIFSITKEVEIVSLKSQFKSETKTENKDENKDPNIMKKDNILGLEIESIQQDGDCFFTAAAKAFPNSNKNVEDRVKELREIAANNLEEKDVEYSFKLKDNIFKIFKEGKLDENSLNEDLLNNSILIYIYKNYNDFETILKNVDNFNDFINTKEDERGHSLTSPSAQILNGLKKNIKDDKTFWADEQIINILKTNLRFNTYKYSENGIEQLGLDNIYDNNVILQYQNGNHYNIYKKREGNNVYVFTNQEIEDFKKKNNQSSGGRTFKNNKRRLRRRKKNGTKKLNKKF